MSVHQHHGHGVVTVLAGTSLVPAWSTSIRRRSSTSISTLLALVVPTVLVLFAVFSCGFYYKTAEKVRKNQPQKDPAALVLVLLGPSTNALYGY